MFTRTHLEAAVVGVYHCECKTMKPVRSKSKMYIENGEVFPVIN
jgi:hypothetical protein